MREQREATTPNPDTPAAEAPRRVSRSRFMRLGVWFTLALWLVTALLPLPFGRPGVWSRLDPADLLSWRTALSGLSGLVVGAAVFGLILCWRPLHVVAKRLADLVAWDTFGTADYVAVALMAALGEEPLFRGALQPLIGLLPTAALFGLLHATSVAHATLAGLLGLALGWLYQWSGSLWPPIAAHLAVDLATGLLMARTLGPNAFTARGN